MIDSGMPIKKLTNLMIRTLLMFIILLSLSCSTILAPKTLHVEGRYSCDADCVLKGSFLCNIQLTNRDTFDWHDVTVVLNDHYNYSENISLLKAGETYEANLANFITNDGTRFDIRVTKPLRITVTSVGGIYRGSF